MFSAIFPIPSKYWLTRSWPWWLSVGLIMVQFMAQLWLSTWLICLASLAILAFCSRQARGVIVLAGLVSLGAAWGSYWGQNSLNNSLPPALVKQDVWVEGTVLDLPQQRSHVLKFKFHIDNVNYQDQTYPFTGDSLLNWYDKPYPSLRVGEKWRFKVRLKPAHGSLNPGGFNYEQWLFSQGIRVTGYVRSIETMRLISAQKSWHIFAKLRADIKSFIEARNLSMGGILKALAIGERSSIDEHQWQVFRNTGTAHLVAISGLHIGLVAGIAYFLAQLLWRHTLLTFTYIPAQTIAQIAALLAALGYSALAGFALPTLRALMMLIAYFTLRSFGRNPGTLFTLGFVLATVLVFDPLAPLTASLWLSFGAVAAIAHVMGSHKKVLLEDDIASSPKNGFIPTVKQRLGQWAQIQWAVFIALMPLSLLFFSQFSIVSLPSNFIAIPVIGLLVVPLVLASVIFFSVGLESIASSLLVLANNIIGFIWPMLNKLALMPFSIWQSAAPSLWAVGLAALCAIILLAPKYGKWRFLGALGFIPMFIPNASGIADGDFELQVLDVGQGLAVMVQTRQHNLLFDAGIKYQSGFDVGQAIIVPFMRQRGISKIDAAVISHQNVDHYGGMAAALASHPNARRYSSAAFYMGSKACVKGMQWQWDNVTFSFIHPQANNQASDNNDSCVLKISGAFGSVLITGDIERQAEQILLADDANPLRADVLIVPHHGSKTSSSMAFLQAIKPDIAVISAGKLNRFSHPHKSVVKRYRAQGVQIFNTANSGWIRISFDQTGVQAHLYRPSLHRYWLSTPD